MDPNGDLVEVQDRVASRRCLTEAAGLAQTQPAYNKKK